MGVIDKVAWLLIKDGTLLSTRSRGKDVWYIPGGKREDGESDCDTLRREVAEELSVAITPGTETLYGMFEAQAHGHGSGILVRMTLYQAAYTGTLTPASEVAALDWLSYADIDRVSPVDRLIFEDLHGKGLLR